MSVSADIDAIHAPDPDAVRCVMISAPFSGIEVYFRNLQRVFADRDDIDVVGTVWLQHRPAEILSRIPPLSLHWMAAGWWSTTRQLGGLRRKGLDWHLLFVNHLNPATLLGRHRRGHAVVLRLDATPRLVTAMGPHYLGRDARPRVIERLKTAVYRKAYSRATHIVTMSTLVKESLVGDYGVDPSTVTVVPNSVDLDRWSPAVGANGRENRMRILFVGGEFERMGGHILLETAALPEFSDFEFHFVTKSSVRDAPRNVVIHRDLNPRSDALRDLYASASVFVLPTMADFSPNSICEAMAMELPVIACDVGAVGEMVADGENGFLIRAGDKEALRSRLSELVASSGLRHRMGKAGRAMAENSFDLDSNAERIVAVLRRAASRER